MNDPTMDVFHKLAGLEEEQEEDDKNYPGPTPPRNASDEVDDGLPEWLDSLPYHEMLTDKGENKRFYTIGSLSQALGKKPVTIRSWEHKGWMPTASYRTPSPQGEQVPGKAIKGKRLYSLDQVVFMVKAYQEYILNPAKSNWDGFRAYIKRYYPKR